MFAFGSDATHLPPSPRRRRIPGHRPRPPSAPARDPDPMSRRTGHGGRPRHGDHRGGPRPHDATRSARPVIGPGTGPMTLPPSTLPLVAPGRRACRGPDRARPARSVERPADPGRRARRGRPARPRCRSPPPEPGTPPAVEPGTPPAGEGPRPDPRPTPTASHRRAVGVHHRAAPPVHQEPGLRADARDPASVPDRLRGRRRHRSERRRRPDLRRICPSARARCSASCSASGEIGYELQLDPRTPVVVGVYPMRPVSRD